LVKLFKIREQTTGGNSLQARVNCKNIHLKFSCMRIRDGFIIPLHSRMEERKYLTTWKRYLPVIRLHLKKSLNEEQQFKLNITDFESAGDRGKSGYTFNLALENGKVTNNISGSAVARDLYEALKSDDTIKAMLQDRSIKISVGKSFVLSIKNNHLSAYK
jgi:hypothetical protein